MTKRQCTFILFRLREASPSTFIKIQCHFGPSLDDIFRNFDENHQMHMKNIFSTIVHNICGYIYVVTNIHR